MSFEINAKLSLDSKGFVKGADSAAKSMLEVQKASDIKLDYTRWSNWAFWSRFRSENEKASSALTTTEKAAVTAGKALADLRKTQAQAAGASRSGTEFALQMAFGRDPYNKMAAEERAYKAHLDKLAILREGAIARNKSKALSLGFTESLQELDSQAPRIRYALYDIGNRALAAGVAIAGVGVAAVTAFAKFESAFTSVERTSGLAGTQLESLRSQLINLSTTVPVSFQDISAIATLGAQMGIAAEDLAQFTKTVSEFSTITGISVEQTAQSFGRLSQLMNVPVEQFANLSSSIAFAGVNAVATDREIIVMAESIAATGTQAGLSADEVIGFATALSSLKVRPEEARGVLLRLFRTIDLAVSESGTALDDFSKVLGLTASESASLWKQDPSQFVQSFLAGAKSGDQLNNVITALGITNTREANVIQRLAGNIDVLKTSLDDAAGSYALGSYASEAYGKVVDDLESRIAVFTNSLQALIAEVGAPLAEFLKPIVMILTDIVNGVRRFAESAPLLSALLTILLALGGVFLTIKAGFALAIAGLLAFRTATEGLKGSLAGLGINMKTVSLLSKQMFVDLGLTGGAAAGASTKFAGLTATLVGYGASARAATVATRVLNVALGPVGWAITALALAASMVDWDKMTSGSNASGEAMINAAGGADALMTAVSADTALGKGFATLAIGVAALTEEEENSRRAALEAAVARNEANKETEAGKDAYEKSREALAAFNKEVEAANEGVSTNTAVLGKNTAAFILNGLSQMGGDASRDFWKNISSLPSGTQAALEAIGFDAGQMVAEGLTEGGETSEQYSARFAGALATIQASASLTSADLANLLGKRYDIKINADGVDKLRKKMEETGPIAGDYVNTLIEGGKASDEGAAAAKANVTAQDSLKTVLQELGIDADDTGTEIESLSELMLKYTAAALAGTMASSGINSSFAQVATSLENVDGALNILTGDGRAAIGDWASFLNQSIELAISSGGGFSDAVVTMASGLIALENAGKNTSVQFQMLRDVIIKNIVQSSPFLRGYAAELEGALNIKDLQAKLNQRILLAKADAVLFLGKGDVSRYEQIMKDVTNLKKTADSLSGSSTIVSDFGKVYDDAMSKVDKSTKKGQTALEKLIALINKAFSYTNIFANLRSSLDSLGDSLRENGKSFSTFTEAGRGNISALQDVVTQLANKSGGDVKKFANDMVSLRKVLADAGVPASGLKLIDVVLKQLKVTGKVSASAMKDLKKALGEVGKENASIQKVVDVTRRLAQAVTSAFDANFAYADSIDAITLGNEAMADSQRQAAERMQQMQEQAEGAAEAITEARIAIDEANASISELGAQRSKLEYQLQIALKYGDSLRAQAIGAEIAKIDADVAKERNSVADANKQILDSQREISQINTEVNRPRTATEIINENKALREMASNYANMTTFMLMNAKEGEDLNKIVDAQVLAFTNNATAMGYTQAQATAVAAVLRDSLLGQINAVKDAKMDLGITVDVDTASSDLSGFVVDANNLLKGINPGKVTVETNKAKADVVAAVKAINAQMALIKDRTVTVTTVHQSTGGSALGVIRRASGGLVTGPGTATSDSIAARLSNGEYVVKTAAVKHYGVDFMNALNNMSLQNANMGGASISVAGSQTVYLSPEDRQLLRAAIDRPIALYTDNATIARSANDGNSILAQRGTR